MPELPEVETIRRQLNSFLVGKKIKAVEIFLPKIIKAPQPEFEEAVIGSKIKNVRRRAKILILELSSGHSILIHLKLTGQLIFQESARPRQAEGEAGGIKNRESWKYTHLIFNFFNGSRLLFNDLRQFGYVKLVKTEKLTEFLAKENFGPEPLAKSFTFKVFQDILSCKPRARVKQFLMDQKNLAGIGNIYSDEILFFAGVHPLRRVGTLKEKEIKKIFEGLKKILQKAIRHRGTSADTYFDAFGQEGKFLKELKVYGREGKNCVKCEGKIKRIKIGGRSAHFCPRCQK